MTRHFGVLIPSTNTTVEIECRLLPATYQAHIGRLMTSTPGRTFAPSRDEDIDYQSRLLGTAKVELVILAQTSASLFADDYDELVTRRTYRNRLALFGRDQSARQPLFRREARA
jgi:maleate isomerase